MRGQIGIADERAERLDDAEQNALRRARCHLAGGVGFVDVGNRRVEMLGLRMRFSDTRCVVARLGRVAVHDECPPYVVRAFCIAPPRGARNRERTGYEAGSSCTGWMKCTRR